MRLLISRNGVDFQSSFIIKSVKSFSLLNENLVVTLKEGKISPSEICTLCEQIGLIILDFRYGKDWFAIPLTSIRPDIFNVEILKDEPDSFLFYHMESLLY